MGTLRVYSNEFKEMALQKLMLNNSSIAKTASIIGIPTSTLFCWKRDSCREIDIKKTKDKSKHWTPEQKLGAIIKTANMPENELGEYLRKNGLYSATLQEWKEQLLSGFKAVGRPKTDPELSKLQQREKDLTRDLNRKNKALAEMAARIVLLKKSQEILGVREDDE
jgi:transposase-like protein